MFEKTLRLFDNYHRQHANDGPAVFDSHLAREVRGRLRLLEHLYRRVLALQDQLWAAEVARRGPRPEDTNWVLVFAHLGVFPQAPTASEEIEPLAVHEEILMLAEGFYYSAHRILVIFRQARKKLPGLKELNVEGVTRVRNNLLEHANKQGGTSIFSFSISNVAGIRFRPVARVGGPEAYVDEGILTNARELQRELESAISGALSSREHR